MHAFVNPARLERGEKQGVIVITFRDLAEAITQGKRGKAALWQAADCPEEVIAGRIAARDPTTVEGVAKRTLDSCSADGRKSRLISR